MESEKTERVVCSWGFVKKECSFYFLHPLFDSEWVSDKAEKCESCGYFWFGNGVVIWTILLSLSFNIFIIYKLYLFILQFVTFFDIFIIH
jgi:hypothetical protein